MNALCPEQHLQRFSRFGPGPSDRSTQEEGVGRKVSGGDFEEATPDPIPNSEVKLFGADGTAREAVWESRTLPGLFPKRL
jgi:hypothetical protein